MKHAAAISAQLVDMRNVGTHKSLKLTLHVPEEEALKAIEAFGWPTGAHPVPVAIAMLDLQNAKPDADSTAPRRAKVAPEKRLAQQAGIRCADPMFIKFIRFERNSSINTEEGAAAYVRAVCGIASRSEIVPGSRAAKLWDDLHGAFILWRDAPELASPDHRELARAGGRG